MEFEWTNFYREKILPKMTYSTSLKYSFKLERDYSEPPDVDYSLLE